MWPIFKRVLKDRRILLIIYSLSSIALLWMYIALFPSFQSQSRSLEELIKSYPESFLKAFNFDINSLTTIEGFLSTEQFSFVWPLLVIFMTVGYAGSAFAGEIEKGTIEILLSQPISRLKIFFGKYLSGLMMLFIFTFVSVYAAVPLSRSYDISVDSKNFLTMTLLAILFSWAIYAIGIFFSAVFSDKGKVFFLSGIILVAMYVLNILASIKESLSDLKYASFFYYFNPSKALVYNEIDHWSYLIFIGVIVLFTIMGAVYFTKRDATN
ncbi:hypothetical protein A2V71_03070 [Candidatus Berkelbacteria bacterium RBG_13_40_8]|uniref:ABC transporter permease n=1 Tax=Candidatus Berkelbacteria bacterium RBG_13_40_8 TaxID=1797467 RepID=A0A1F5DP52_9BACT|nr:MAG: hypothetical protein A2V71_03070 [Candidatus Berkelbacteria bacterium RBG_13_40_8]